MKYLITGDISLNNLEIDNLLNKEKDYSLIKYDLEQDPISKVVEELNTIDLFSKKKIVIVFSLEKIDKGEELINYLEKSADSNILILTSCEKLDERKKVIKVIKEKCKIIDTKNTNIDSYIKDNLKDYKISFEVLNLLKEYTNCNYFRIKQELDKLKMLKVEEKVITKEDIISVVRKGFDKNIFDFIKAINEKNKPKIFEIYYELINNKEDELKIISTLANTFRQIYKLKVLKDYNSDAECMNILNIKNPYRLKKLKEECYNYSSNSLLKYLRDLSLLDIKIKSGLIDKKFGMELFLTKI